MSRVQILTVAVDDGDQRLDRWFKTLFSPHPAGPRRKDVPQG